MSEVLPKYRILLSVGLCAIWLYAFRLAKISNGREVLGILLAFAARSVLLGTIVTLSLGRIPFEPLQEVICAADRRAVGVIPCGAPVSPRNAVLRVEKDSRMFR